MAVDTANKRFSMMAMRTRPIIKPMIIPDGTIATADMQHILGRYAGIAFNIAQEATILGRNVLIMQARNNDMNMPARNKELKL